MRNGTWVPGWCGWARRSGHWLAISLALTVHVVAPAAAQFREVSQLVTVPGASLAAPDNAYAADLNPAALGFLPSWSLRYVHVGAASDDRLVGRGDALYFGTPLFFGLSVGASAQSVRPSEAAGLTRRGAFSLALAYAPSRYFSVGTSLRYFGSLQNNVDDLTALDLAVSVRPSSYLALSLINYDALGPLDLTGYNSTVHMSTVLAAAVRPWGDDRLTVEAAGGLNTDGRAGARTMLELGFGPLGKVHAVGEFADIGGSAQQLRGIVGWAVDWGYVGVAGGVLVGDGLSASPGWYVAARAEGTRQVGLPEPRYVADFEVQGDLGPRQLLRLLARLDAAARDPRVVAVLLRLRSTDMNLAYAQELRLALQTLQKAGKKAFCHLDAASGSEYYACSVGGQVFVDPAGGLRLMGIAQKTLLFGETLQRLGVRADFVRIGQYKSAPEQWMNRVSSPPAVHQRKVYLDDLFARMVEDLARDMHIDETQVRELIDRGPYIASEAQEARLVRGQVDELELDETLDAALGKSFARQSELSKPPQRSWGIGPRIAVVVVDGTIVDGDNVDIPFVDVHLSGGRTVASTLEDLGADPSVAAIVLRVDSPGGSALASDQIWRAVQRVRRHKPVVASLGAVAASGGYYVASAAQEIWADPATLTGSIGVFFGKVDVEGLAQKLGVGVEVLRQGRNAGVESVWRPFTDDERQMLSVKVQKWYELFLQRVAKGRRMTVQQVHRVAQGRIWSGDRALAIGLVDHLGGYSAALQRARQLGGLRSDCEVVVVPERPEKLLDYLWKAGGRQARGSSSTTGGQSMGLPPWLGGSIRRLTTALATLGNTRVGVPLAWLPAVVEAE